MGDEVKEIVYTAANLIFIAAVLLVGLMFFSLRTTYANTLAEKQITEQRIAMQNKFREYDSKQVTGYDVMSAITAYSDETPMYVTGAYNYDDTSIIQNRLYSAQTRRENPAWFKMSFPEGVVQGSLVLQNYYRKDSVYYAILTYDSDTPQKLAQEMGLDTASGGVNLDGRNAGAYNTSIGTKIAWLSSKFQAVRPEGVNGYTVSGILFICVDAYGAPAAKYQQISIY